MDVIDIEKLILLVENHECIWKNQTINAANLLEVEAAWRSAALSIYENFDDLKENQKRFWVNNLKRKWKLVLNKFKTLGSDYEYFILLQFLIEPKGVISTINSDLEKSKGIENIEKITETSNITNISYTEPLKCGEILFENGGYTYKCGICISSFSSLDCFEIHVSKVHLLPLFRECQIEKLNDIVSNENVEYLYDEDIKQENHLEPIPESKTIVGQLKSNYSESEIELVNFHNTEYIEELTYDDGNEVDSYRDIDNTNQIECPHCNVIFQSLSEHDFERCSVIQEKILKLHGDLRALRDEGIFHCDRCSKYFNSANEMHHHRREEHYEICPVCKIRLLNVENHIISHHKEIDYKKLKIPDSFNSGKFECKLCNRIFLNKDMWMKHKNSCCETEYIENHKKIRKLF